jgi:LPS-assembly protein
VGWFDYGDNYEGVFCMRWMILLVLLILLFFTGYGFAKEAEILVKADYVERMPEVNLVIARGDVEIIYDDTKIWADEVHMNTETKDVVATGNVVIWEISEDEKGKHVRGYMKCDKLEFNMDTKKGVAYRARGYLDPFYYFEGTKVVKVDEDTYNIDNGTLTTCTSECNENPDWHLRGSRIAIKTESYTKVFGVSGWIKSIPVLYSPYLQVPSKSERKSGLLVPTFGYKTDDKFFIKVPVYFVINRSSDLTLWFTPYSSGSLGTAFEYRNVFSKDEKLKIKGDYIQHKDGDVRWALKGGFNKYVGIDTELKGSVSIKNTSYRRYYADTFGEYSEIYSDSYLQFLKRTDYTSLNVLLRYQSDNISGSSQKLYKEPEMDFNVFPINTKIINNLFVGGYGGLLVYKNKNDNLNLDYTLTRLMLEPKLYLPFTFLETLKFLPTYSYSYTYWSRSRDGEGRVSQGSISRDLGNIGVYVRGPIAMKPYKLPVLGELYHFVVPEVKYIYIPRYGDRTRVVIFDERDTLNDRNYVTYSLSNRFLAVRDGVVKEVLRVAFEQDYRMHSLVSHSKNFSDVRVIFDIYPRNFYINTRLFYNVYGKGITTKALTFGYSGNISGDTRGNFKVNYYEDNIALSRYMEYTFGFGVSNLEANFALRRDIKNDYWPEKVFYVGYAKNCWAMRVGYRILDTTLTGGRKDRTLYFIVIFKGLGGVGVVDETNRDWINMVKNKWKVNF